MLYQNIPLDPNHEDVFLEAFVPGRIGTHLRKAILVIPGGGYHNLCFDREGEPIAQAFLPYDYAAFVLHYSVSRSAAFPAQLIQAAKAIAYIKDHAQEYGVDPEKLFTVGFSAGGHLAGCTGILWKHPAIYDALNIPYGYCKPKGMMLIYPVINNHEGSFCNLLCSDTPSEEQLDQVRLDQLVDEDTVPAFIMHTANDQAVPVRNSLDLASALSKVQCPFELHIYPDSPHGVALGNDITTTREPKHTNSAIAKWVEHAVYWADHL